MRAFVAIDLPEAIRDAITDLQGWLPVGRQVVAENLHLTLAFLGEQPDPVIGEVDEALAALVVPAFDLQLAGLDVFGGRSPDLVFLGVAANPALRHLQRKIMTALREGPGLDLARVRFRPHVTLARFSRRPDAAGRERLGAFLAAHADVRLPAFRVRRFTLYSSVLGRGVARHHPLADYALVPSPADPEAGAAP